MNIELKDILKLDFITKSILLCILLTMPFWYISFYLFNKPFFKTADVPLRIVFAFCLSITWSIWNIILAWFEQIFFRSDIDRDTPGNIFGYSTALSIVSLCFSILFNYLDPTFNYPQFLFNSYKNGALFYLGIFLFMMFIRQLGGKQENKKEASKEQSDAA